MLLGHDTVGHVHALPDQSRITDHVVEVQGTTGAGVGPAGTPLIADDDVFTVGRELSVVRQ